MKVNIEKPINGWIKIDISEKDQQFSDTLSYTPEDFIYKLIETLNLISSYEGKYIFEGFSEPIEYDFVFEAIDDNVVFQIVSKDGGNYKTLFEYEEQRNNILTIFFRAISKMKSGIDDKEYKKSWGYDFPELKFQKLKSYLKQIKKTV
ncbi:MAG: hypothetical protein OQJ93_08930 [Ignavibacteriaceae bacterium]|jgi:hypothetical protein|nr:hypothetical protein [Ignavibacteriaceae bacterium]MCW9097500.1 hypothetical protein [Ignavibacteriaceae bacterium]